MEDVPARTLNLSPAGDLLAAARSFRERVSAAVRAFRGALHKDPVRAEEASTPKSPPGGPHRTPPWLESGNLPETYGRTRVVAMVVSPYMVHVYWDLSRKDQAQSGPASLRFHDAATGDHFDINIDLAAKNWYVHLWSPDKQYTVELGSQRGGAFAPLARSNPIQTPRAWPVAEIARPEQAAMRVPAPEVSTHPASATRPPALLPSPAPFHLDTSAPVRERPPATEPAPSAQAPGTAELQDLPQPSPRPVPFSAVEMLRKRLSELYGFRRRARHTPPAGTGSAEELSSFLDLPDSALLEAHLDFTGRVETQFSPGLSSVRLGIQRSTKPGG